MSFEIGQAVVYPHHGIITIEKTSTRGTRGEERMHFTLRVSRGGLTIQVPADNVDLVGVCGVVGKNDLKEVLSVLHAPHIEEPTD